MTGIKLQVLGLDDKPVANPGKIVHGTPVKFQIDVTDLKPEDIRSLNATFVRNGTASELTWSGETGDPVDLGKM